MAPDHFSFPSDNQQTVRQPSAAAKMSYGEKNGDTKKCVTGWSALMRSFVLAIILIEFSRVLSFRGSGVKQSQIFKELKLFVEGWGSAVFGLLVKRMSSASSFLPNSLILPPSIDGVSRVDKKEAGLMWRQAKLGLIGPTKTDRTSTITNVHFRTTSREAGTRSMRRINV